MGRYQRIDLQTLRRFTPILRLRAALRAGRLGKTPRLSLRWGELPGNWAKDPAAWRQDDSSALLGMGADAIDLIEWLAGPVTLDQVRHDGLGGPSAEAEIGFGGDGAAGMIEVSRLRQLGNRLTIEGTAGAWAIDLDTGRLKGKLIELVHAGAAAGVLSPCSGPTTAQRLAAAGREAARLRHPWEIATPRVFPELRGRRILVVGATGFIGARLVERLVEEGASVTAAARDLRRAARIARYGIALVKVGADTSLAALVSGRDAVINLAYDLSAPASANAAAAEALARAACEAGVGRFVHASSIAVYDGWPTEDLNETSPSDGPGHDYKRGKRSAERALAAIAEHSGLELAILQFTNVYGPFSRLWTDEFAERLEAGPVIVPDRGLCNGVHVDDAVNSVMAACVPNAATGRLIVTGPEPFRWRDLMEGYAQAIGGQVVVEPTAAPLAHAPTGKARRLDLLSFARSPLVRPLVDRLRRQIGEERLTLLRRRLLKLIARGRPAQFRLVVTNARLFTATAKVDGRRSAELLGPPTIDLARGVESCAAYLRWRRADD